MGCANASELNITDNNLENNELDLISEYNDYYTFSDLQKTINSSENNSNIILNGYYKYDKIIDGSKDNITLKEGVVISKNLKITGKNCTIDGSYVARCLYINSHSCLILENITIINGYSKTNDGGGIHACENVNLTIINCVFKNNKIYNHNGGAVYTDNNSNIEIKKCLFENNTSIRVSKLAWKDYKEGMGSVLFHRINSTLTMEDSIVRNNNAYLSTILLVSYDDVIFKLSKLFIKNCLFENNTSKRCGVVYIDEFGEGEILDCTFVNNHSPQSTGTLILDTCQYSLVKNCNFINNTGKNGAAICIERFTANTVSNVDIVNCNFINNVASENGGAISSIGGVVSIKNSKFEKNNALGIGGAIYSKYGSLSVINTQFNHNVASCGGAIYSSTSNSKITNNMFLNNQANDSGAAIYLKEYGFLSNCVYNLNKAPNDKNNYGIHNAFKVTGKIIANNLITTYKSGKTLKITLKNAKTNKFIVCVKLVIKVYTGKKYKTFYATTNLKGEYNFKVSDFTAGTHKITINSAENCVKLKKSKTIYLVIYKSKPIVKAPKITKKFKSKSLFKITTKYKSSKKPIKNLKLTIKIKTGKKVKSIVKKTNSKGFIWVSTKFLNKGKHQVIITSSNANFNINKKSLIIIK